MVASDSVQMPYPVARRLFPIAMAIEEIVVLIRQDEDSVPPQVKVKLLEAQLLIVAAMQAESSAMLEKDQGGEAQETASR